MPDSSVALSEPLLQQEVPCGAHCDRKDFMLPSWIICLGAAMVLCSALCTFATGRHYLAFQEPAITMDGDSQPMKIDPTNGVEYSFAQLSLAYQGKKSADEIKAYWDTECKELTTRPTDEPPLQLRAVFMDQKGSRYHEDLKTLEDQGLLLPGAVVIADNSLKPGAPVFCWQMLNSGAYDTEIVSLKEFSMPAEDWMVVGVRRNDPKASLADAPETPSEIAQIQWETDRIRDKATSGEGSVNYGEWAAYSQDMKNRLKKYGIAATKQGSDYADGRWPGD